MPHFLNDAEFAALTAICDTLFGPNPHDLPRAVAKALRDHATDDVQQAARQCLARLASPAGMLLLSGQRTPFAQCPAERRAELVARWATGQPAFNLIRRLAQSAYAHATAPPDLAAPAPPAPLRAVGDLDCDIAIVGGEPAAWVAATALAEGGQRVIVVTEDAHPVPPVGTQWSADLGVMLTTGQSRLTLPPSPVLRDIWGRQYGLARMFGSDFTTAIEAVTQRDPATLAGAAGALAAGAVALGYHHGRVAAPADDPWPALAREAGAQVVSVATVEQVTTSKGKATGLRIRSEGKPAGIHARRVVLATSTARTAALLSASGLQSAAIRQALYLQPGTLVVAEFAEPQPAALAFSDEFANLDGDYHGARLIQLSPAPALLGGLLPWHSRSEFSNQFASRQYRAVIAVTVRDRDAGKLRAGNRAPAYALSRHDREHLLAGIEGAVRLMAAAQATAVTTMHAGLPGWRQGDSLDDYVHTLWHQRSLPALFSAVQTGTCPMGMQRTTAVLRHTSETWDVGGLFVADAAAFPTAIGAGQLRLRQALAWRAAQFVLQRL